MCDFKPGDEVCLRRDIGPVCRRQALSVGWSLSFVFVIETVFIDTDDEPSLTFVNTLLPPGSVGAKAKYFRKVRRKSTETGMAILRGILDGKDVIAPAVEVA